MNPTTNSTPRMSLALRFTGLLLLVPLLILCFFWAVSLVQLPGKYSWLADTSAIALLVLFILAVWRKWWPFRSWRNVGIGAALYVPLLVWLAWDDAAYDHPVTIEQISPAPPKQAEESFAATLAYTEVAGKPAAHKLPEVKFSLKNDPTKDLAKWKDEIVQNRDNIATSLATLAEAREWLTGLDRFEFIGDYAQTGYDMPIMRTEVVRRVSNLLCGQAGVLALDGQGDAALALLRPLASVLLKLENHARSEIRILTASTNLARVCATAQFVLSTTACSGEAKAAFATAIAHRDLPAVAHRLAWLPYAHMMGSYFNQPGALGEAFAEFSDPWVRPLLRILRPFAVLPRRTANDLAPLALDAEATLTEPKHSGPTSDYGQFYGRLHTLSPKNMGGRFLLAIAVPSYVRMGENLRAGEKARLDLLAALH